MSSSPSTFGPPPNQYSIPLPLIIFLAIFGVIFVCAFVFTVYRIVAIRQGWAQARGHCIERRGVIMTTNTAYLPSYAQNTPPPTGIIYAAQPTPPPAYLTSTSSSVYPAPAAPAKDTKPEKQTTTTNELDIRKLELENQRLAMEIQLAEMRKADGGTSAAP